MASLNMANNIRILREYFGYSVSQVSKYLGMSQPGYLKYEGGQAEVPMETLEKLSDLYNVDELEIMEGDARQMKVLAAFADYSKGFKGNLEDVAHFQRIVRNYLSMCDGLKEN